MKKFILTLLILSFFQYNGKSQTSRPNIHIADSSLKIIPAELSCGQCQFHLAGKGCNLAVRINGKAYYVEGASIDDFGDAHADDGFCNAVRKAEVQGKIVKNKFRVRYAKLIQSGSN